MARQSLSTVNIIGAHGVYVHVHCKILRLQSCRCLRWVL